MQYRCEMIKKIHSYVRHYSTRREDLLILRSGVFFAYTPSFIFEMTSTVWKRIFVVHGEYRVIPHTVLDLLQVQFVGFGRVEGQKILW